MQTRAFRFRRFMGILPVAAILLAGAGTASFGASVTDHVPSDVKLTIVARGLESPVLATAVPGDERLFIVQQNGVISVLEDGGVRTVLDLGERVTFSGEAGMLGLALHPDFKRNGLAYVSYTRGRLTSVIKEYRFDEAAGRFDVESGREIYSLEQPAGNHNGGMVAFGPEGYLYIGFGDGGGANDTYANGQNFDSALGSIVRIGVGPGFETPFEIPPDNPRTDGPAPEVWVYGLRNPWRFSFDDSLLYIGDVGQSGQEEVHVLEAGAASSGLNLGWPLAEGNACLGDAQCREKELNWPVLTYATSDGCAITGGYVYRGDEIPELKGHYFYGDFCSGEISSFVYQDGEVSKQRSWNEILGPVEFISGFGRDGFGELYVVSLTGTIYRLDPA
ncbi:MAG TPA: glucose dehydrogenase [Devosia sp.]|nr:glucose dehydrogenase [Devosia sp.]